MKLAASFLVAIAWLVGFSGSGDEDSTRLDPPPAAGDSPSVRTVAVTFDDLPAVRGGDIARTEGIVLGLLKHLSASEIPAFGFVNESRLGTPTIETERVALLERWVEAGHGLGNHTYSHPSLYRTPLAEFQADVIRGEKVTAELLKKHGQQIRYFRHPFLNTGPDLATKTAFEEFLAEHDYVVAPVTIDNDEYLYALAYDRAVTAGNETLAARIGADYIRYMCEVFAFCEELSRDLLGREVAQILLLHSNALNAEYLDELAAMIVARGYAFVSLPSALEDPAYSLPDSYVGPTGPSWLQRWSITQGNERRETPDVPQWVREAAE